MSEEGREIPREFVLKQIENEMAAARRALQISQPVEKAAVEADGSETDGSETGRVRAVTRQIIELREAIDILAARGQKDSGNFLA